MACLRLTYRSNFEVLKGGSKKELTIKKSVLNLRSVYFYGFQSYESDNEVKGQGNSYTTEFRQYDSRLGRWLTIDPYFSSYPSLSSYNSYNNSPIYLTDKNGGYIEFPQQSFYGNIFSHYLKEQNNNKTIKMLFYPKINFIPSANNGEATYQVKFEGVFNRFLAKRMINKLEKNGKSKSDDVLRKIMVDVLNPNLTLSVENTEDVKVKNLDPDEYTKVIKGDPLVDEPDKLLVSEKINDFIYNDRFSYKKEGVAFDLADKMHKFIINRYLSEKNNVDSGFKVKNLNKNKSKGAIFDVNPDPSTNEKTIYEEEGNH